MVRSDMLTGILRTNVLYSGGWSSSLALTGLVFVTITDMMHRTHGTWPNCTCPIGLPSTHLYVEQRDTESRALPLG